MADSPDRRRLIDRRALLTFLTDAIECAPQECRNRFQKRIATMGAGSIAIIIANRMKKAGWEITRPDRDAEGAIMGRATPSAPDGP